MPKAMTKARAARLSARNFPLALRRAKASPTPDMSQARLVRLRARGYPLALRRAKASPTPSPRGKARRRRRQSKSNRKAKKEGRGCP